MSFVNGYGPELFAGGDRIFALTVYNSEGSLHVLPAARRALISNPELATNASGDGAAVGQNLQVST